ncbi:6090_t:CDS:2, partial [Acaulospora morrowiae]
TQKELFHLHLGIRTREFVCSVIRRFWISKRTRNRNTLELLIEELTQKEIVGYFSIPLKLFSNNGIYQDIKKRCAIKLGVLSQCIVGSHIEGSQGKWRLIFASIVLKINGKLSGTNYTLARREIGFFERDLKEKTSVISIRHVTPVHYARHIAKQTKYFIQYEEYLTLSTRGGRSGRDDRGTRRGRDCDRGRGQDSPMRVKNGRVL